MTKSEYHKQYRARLTAQGFCRTCLKRPATKGKKTCAECREHDKQYKAANRDKFLDYSKQYAATRRANALCVVYAILIAGFKYIGSTHTYEIRKVGHLSSLRLGKHENKVLQALYNEHGPDALEFVVLATLEKSTSKLERLAIEQSYIDGTPEDKCLNVNSACRYCDAA